MNILNKEILTKKELESLYMKEGLIQSISGIIIDLENPLPENFLIEDIAKGLSNNCRFGGQLATFYSVAQHSCLVAELLEDFSPEIQMQGLMHDASEAYLLDILSPLKLKLPQYKVIEQKFTVAICKKFNIEYPFNSLIKVADRKALELEHKALRLKKSPMYCENTEEAFSEFMQRYEDIKNEL